ncbi:MAG: hypothetical protein A3G87_00310 [Omnitrophica bacterium RIFCSPLOWO2_12_FULL_50_11]|nr:MAG: hypothetical protein A3G87_00310 [Omnitrophica bacterium RIFCSPLOWO2_12_FULL_50_11]
MKTLKAGVIGLGHLGKEHARLYHELPNAELTALCDTDLEKSERAKAFGLDLTTDYRKILHTVDLVSIVTPTSTHYEIAKAALERGVHVLIEKPMTYEVGEADELIKLAKEKNLTLKVGHLERYNAGYLRVQQLAHDIRFIEIHRLGPFNPRINDCGVVLDLMIHDLDLVLQLVKSEIASIDAIGVNVLTPYEDIANVRMKFENKAIADLTASRLTPEAQRKIRIFQEDAYISLDYVAQSAQIYRRASFPQALFSATQRGGSVIFSGGGGKISREQITVEKEEPLRAELEDFVRSVGRGTSHGKPDVQARDALCLAHRILASIQENAPTPAHAV